MAYQQQRSPVTIEFCDISYSISLGKNKGKKLILKNISGEFHAGKLTAILGPSGAGKSTLMDIVAGVKLRNVEGSIFVDGKVRNPTLFKRLSCYIPQQDTLIPFITVLEAMNMASRLKLPRSTTDKERQTIISDILDMLNLSNCLNTQARNLSGGEKKRLSISFELLSNPPVMFFDEPTSGLDSMNSFHCVNILKNLAKGGRTIICSIHQPSAKIFEKFDNLFAMAEGQCIYRGPVLGLITFLQEEGFQCPSYHNPADYLIELTAADEGDSRERLTNAVWQRRNHSYDEMPREMNHNHKGCVANGGPPPLEGGQPESRVNGDCVYNCVEGETKVQIVAGAMNPLLTEEDPSSKELGSFARFPNSQWTQFRVLTHRTYLSIIRDPLLTMLRFLVHLFVGILMGLIYHNIGNDASKVFNNMGFLFFTPLFLVFSAMMPTILTFPMETEVFLREHQNCWYSLRAYYWAKTAADLPFQVIFTMEYLVIVYFLTDQPFEWDRFLMLFFIYAMTSLIAQSIGLVIGCLMGIQEAVFFGPVVSVPALLFSGYFVTLSTIPVYLRWLSYLSYVRYTFEGSLITIYGYEREALSCPKPYCHYRLPEKVLDDFDVVGALYWVDALILCLFFFLLRGFGYFVLRWKVRH